jgi:hypothetical protein
LSESQIGNFASRVNLNEGDILIGLRVNLDSSGKLENNYMTLAALAGNDAIWSVFENEWDKILSSHSPSATYVHMKELCPRMREFDWRRGWTAQNTFGLVNECLKFMSGLDKERFRMFYCAIDLAARRKLILEDYDIPEPVEMCNQWVSEFILHWYFFEYPGIVGSIHYFFDASEPFKEPFEKKWISEKERTNDLEVYNQWSLVEEVAGVEMRKVPGVQAADILAWSVNRENTVPEGFPGSMHAFLMRQIIPSFSIVFDEQRMRRDFSLRKPRITTL